MTNKEAKEKAAELIETGYVLLDHDQNEWLSDCDDLFVWMNQRGSWNDWDINDTKIKEDHILLPDDVGGMTLKKVRYCKNQDCDSPFEMSDIEVIEWTDDNFVIQKKGY